MNWSSEYKLSAVGNTNELKVLSSVCLRGKNIEGSSEAAIEKTIADIDPDVCPAARGKGLSGQMPKHCHVCNHENDILEKLSRLANAVFLQFLPETCEHHSDASEQGQRHRTAN